ncbi:MAG: iron ABC transporter permease [Firmicutes bacterium]|nr:iron ABC transporter permease [Bacillota bacterium]
MHLNDNTNQNRIRRWVICFLLISVSIDMLFLWNICAGSVSISVKYILEILRGMHAEDTAYQIIWGIRMPRAFAAMLLGGALSVSGFLLQTFFHNPIAGPFVLGISSGAKLMVALVMIVLLGNGIAVSSSVLILASFIGSMICMGFILLLSRKADNMSALIIGGVMIGYVCSAITDIAVTFAKDTDIVNLHNWSMGSFSGIDWENIKVIVVVVVASLLAAFLMSKPISAYQQGENYAKSVGVNTKLFRIGLILISGLLSACVTAFAGPISFVGIAVPHLIRSLLKTSKPILVIPGCFFGGAAFCLICDLIARTVFAPTDVSISSVTAVFGAPVVIYMLIKRQKGY